MKGMLDVSLSDIHSICSEMGDFSTDQSEGIYLDRRQFFKRKNGHTLFLLPMNKSHS